MTALMSASKTLVTCGAPCRLCTMCAAMRLRIGECGTRRIAAGDSAAGGAARGRSAPRLDGTQDILGT